MVICGAYFITLDVCFLIFNALFSIFGASFIRFLFLRVRCLFNYSRYVVRSVQISLYSVLSSLYLVNQYFWSSVLQREHAPFLHLFPASYNPNLESTFPLTIGQEKNTRTFRFFAFEMAASGGVEDKTALMVLILEKQGLAHLTEVFKREKFTPGLISLLSAKDTKGGARISLGKGVTIEQITSMLSASERTVFRRSEFPKFQ